MKEFKELRQVILIILIFVSISSCKKGEDDSTISLQSRKARLAGEWKLDGYEKLTTTISTIYTSSDSILENNQYSEQYHSTIATEKNIFSTDQDFSSSSGISKQTNTTSGELKQFTLSIKKDGSWKSTRIVYWNKTDQVIETTSNGVTTTANNTIWFDKRITIETSGTWIFLHKNKGLELKNKEAISMAVSKEVTTNEDVNSTGATKTTNTLSFGPTERSAIWRISMLKNKEIHMEQIIDNANGPSNVIITSGGTGSASSANYSKTSGTIKQSFKQ